MNMIDFGMNTQAAGDAPRIAHERSSEPTGERMEDGGELYLESGFPAATVEALRRLGHRFGARTGYYGGYQAIRFDAARRVFVGASEFRKDGCAAGF
jgi:gamma-glutamyltranspeptidase/glutathione hydrolase